MEVSLLAIRTEEADRAEQEVSKPTTVATDKVHPGLEFIPHKKGDPNTFKTYLGQEGLKERLSLRINAMKKGDSLKALFSAGPGLGKTAFSRIIARELGKHGLIENYFEIVAGKVETKLQLDSFLSKVPAYSYVFIDELHGLQGTSRDALLPALQDNVYAFNTGSETMTALPEGISWVAATTDVGKVHGAVQRRFTVFELEPMTFKNRFYLASLLPFAIEEQAAVEIAQRCWTPWEIKDEARLVAQDVAVYEKSNIITYKYTLRAFRILGIDQNGLRVQDRNILETLYKSVRVIRGQTRRGMAARALIMACGLDSATFYDKIEPKLLKMGYIQTAAGIGREITEAAINKYFPNAE